MIDCDRHADALDELASTFLFLAELELTNALHVVDPGTMPPIPAQPSQPMTVISSQSQSDATMLDAPAPPDVETR